MLSLSTKPELEGQVLACTTKTKDECFQRLLFGTNLPYAPAAMRIKEGDFLFLLDLDADVLHGVFKAASDVKMNIQPDAWNGRYPYQVRVRPVGRTIPLANAKKLLKTLGIKRSQPMNSKVTIRLLELYRPKNLQMDKWFQYLSEAEGTTLEVVKEQVSWELLGDIKSTRKETVDELPTLEATTLWDFARQSYGKTQKGDNKHPGVTPAAIIWNLVWRYTVPGDLVVDPMCGSGTTLDVCKEEGRRCICYDISPPPNRSDIIQNDSRRIPLENHSVDMIFVDSPYGDNVRYNDHPDCIGKISSESESFYDELEKVMKESHRILKPEKILGWLIGDQWVKGKFTPVGFRIHQRLSKYFETVDIVCVARRGQASHTALWYNRARRFNFFLRGFKYLFIMRKPLDGLGKLEQRTVKWTYYERNRSKANSS